MWDFLNWKIKIGFLKVGAGFSKIEDLRIWVGEVEKMSKGKMNQTWWDGEKNIHT